MTKLWSPLDIKTVLEFYMNTTNPGANFSIEQWTSEAAAESQLRLLGLGLLENHGGADVLRLSDRGHAFVGFVLSMPLPVKVEKWELPT